ncbi:hypothetical protein JCM5350_004897 [Sporobolomyces pararoseus]
MSRHSKHISSTSLASSPSSLSSFKSKLSFSSSRSRSSSCNSQFPPLSPDAEHTPTVGYSYRYPPGIDVSNNNIPPRADSEIGPFGGDEESQVSSAVNRSRRTLICTPGSATTRGKEEGEEEEEEQEVVPAVELEDSKPRPNSVNLPPSPVLNPAKPTSHPRSRLRSAPRAISKFTRPPLTEFGRGYSIATLYESLPFEQVLAGKLLEYQIRQGEKERATQVIVPAEVLGWQKSRKRPQARRDNSHINQKEKEEGKQAKGSKKERSNLEQWRPLPPQLYTTFAQLYGNDVDPVSSLLS